MFKSWVLPSIPPHNFYLCLDIDSYFDYEHDPVEIPEHGYTRPISVNGREVLITSWFNGDTETPAFHIEASEMLSEDEKDQADLQLARILGTQLDLRPLYDQADNDPVLATKFQELYGLKRMSRATFFDDAINRIIKTQIQHAPTARKMVYGVREAYSTIHDSKQGFIAGWPSPQRLADADPIELKKHGLSLRKGEYIRDLAKALTTGHLDMYELTRLSPESFYDRVIAIRGIGHTTAQDLMLFRERTDAVFPSIISKGRETGLRMWIIKSYGGNPDKCSDAEFQKLIKYWKGYEAPAIEFLYAHWVISEKKKKANN